MVMSMIFNGSEKKQTITIQKRRYEAISAANEPEKTFSLEFNISSEDPKHKSKKPKQEIYQALRKQLPESI